MYACYIAIHVFKNEVSEIVSLLLSICIIHSMYLYDMPVMYCMSHNDAGFASW